ncbi:PXA domain-containing protein [Mycena indigotica]|uniref:PXA domain-containing protein n=1 Tax=Mycena indigotica TaxID=2126181 RepID=A0A8H6SXX9_9AGAR|nr:PXA domain-containing protein [Mycena indigotica]KAF7306701.1 PXA domain-containing protein [Mycena indigotica]
MPTPSIVSQSKGPNQPNLAKRLLFPNSTGDIPPLFSSPNTPPELTAEVYDFIALALRAFVNPWWTKITRYDKQFLPDITRILTHVVRALETRVHGRDLAPLVFRDVPTIVTQHYRDYRNAEAKANSSYASGGALPIPVLFHNLQPHMAVSADGSIDEEYMRQIIDHILKSCLPPEDYAPDPERFVIREIVLKILLKDVIPKITQPWFIHKIILDQLGQDDMVLPESRPESPAASPLSFHTLIVVFLSAIQTLSGTCLAMINAYKQAVSTIKRVNQTPTRPPISRRVSTPLPVPLSPSISASSSVSSYTPSQDTTLTSNPPSAPLTNDYALPALYLVSEIFSTQARMAASSIMHPLLLLAVSFTPFLDRQVATLPFDASADVVNPRLLPYLLMQALSPKLLLTTIRNAKRTLFPNGYPAPPPIDPTLEEQAQMRARLLAYRGKSGWVETHILPLFLGPDPSMTLATAIDPLSSRECNVHLIMLLLDCIIGTLFPELWGQ